MSSRVDAELFKNQWRKRLANQAYVYLIHLLHVFFDLMPGVLRNAVYRRLLGRAGRDIFFDHKVYLKFPWLVEIGDNVSVNRGVEFYSDYQGRHRILIGSNVHIAPNVRFHAAGHDLEDLTRHVGADIRVEDGVWLGAGAILLPGVTVGRDAVVGAGSVVTGDIPPRTIAAGVPARVIRERTA